MRSFEAAGLDAIAGVYAEPIAYTGATLTAAQLMAVPSDVPADPFQGPGDTLRKVSFEIRQASLPAPPRKGDTIAHDGRTWRVNDITRRDDIAAWVLVVEKT